MRTTKTMLAAAALALAAGCTAAERGQIGAIGAKQRVTLYAADGKVVREWVSEGKVATEQHSDGWYFTDDKTGKLVRVSGTVVIEPPGEPTR